MVLSIRTDIPALTSTRHLNRSGESLTSSLERLSTGLRINKAADDSSGLFIADSLTSQALGLGQAIRNANDAISIVQVADVAIKDLDAIRSNLGSVQNQLTSAIAGITAAKVNIFSSASSIRDVDFSEEVQNLKKLQILSEAGKFSLSSSNTRAAGLISLLTQTGQK